MFGIRKTAELGQLALMDALVFFLVATVISSVVLFYSGPANEPPIAEHGQGRSDPDEVLKTVLHASIGDEIVVAVESQRHISKSTEIGQCLLIESGMLIEGAPVSAFGSLNAAVQSILEEVCSPFYEPRMTISELSDAGASQLISIPSETITCENQFGSSVELSLSDGTILLIQLVLAPAALAEVF